MTEDDDRHRQPPESPPAGMDDAALAELDPAALVDRIRWLQRANAALARDHAERIADILALTGHRSQELETLRAGARDAGAAIAAAGALRAEKAALETAVGDLRAHVAALDGARAAAEARLAQVTAEIHASSSWRLTRPLRTVGLLLRRLRSH